MPVFQHHSRIVLTVRKFKCRNGKCKRKVFTEQNNNILPYARRTERVKRLLSDIAIDMPTGSGHVLSEKLQIKVSRSTLTRLAHQQPLPDINTLKIVGVDDWAFRKGVNYRTILVDMETSKPIDMLPTRDSEDLKAWLRDHPGIKIITRHRASSYSTALDSISPNTVQVADPFHLLMNLSDALNTFFKSISPKINKLIKAKTCEMLRDAGAVSGQDSVNKKEIAEIPVPVQKQDTLVPKSHPKRTNIEVFSNCILSKMKIDGYTNMEIINDIRKMGYTGRNTQAYQYLSFLKETNGVTTLNYVEQRKQPIPYIKRLNSRKLAKYVGHSLNHVEDIDHRSYMEVLFDNIPILKRVRRLVKRFKKMLKTGEGQIQEWIKSI
ncbi:transposase [Maribellus maritimus]|uniref:transposase n=1 Tax=Maribellus maritimus TaxID=2870838 RepID=UPI001EEAA0A1|nr:transposase [Maribellus maritimus]MCG6191298.1 transposase [Maribellus maritimus]